MPGEKEVFGHIVKSAAIGDATVFGSHEDWVRVVWQLSNPDPDDPHYIMNVNLPATIAMGIPRTFRSRLTSPPELPMTLANLTPQHTVVDVHLDQARKGVIQCIGRSKKLLLAWPATDLNMEILIKHILRTTNCFSLATVLKGDCSFRWIRPTASSYFLVLFTRQ